MPHIESPSFMTTPTQIPAWLQAASSEQYVRNALGVLAARESKRYTARRASLNSQHATNGSSSLNPGVSKALRSLVGKKDAGKADALQRHVNHYSIATGAHEDHQGMNRYMDIIPYDRTRVVVQQEGSNGGSETAEGLWHGRYLNASWVRELYGRKWWIAAQAPLQYTAHTFLSVMLQPVVRPDVTTSSASEPSSSSSCRVRTVVQLTLDVEGGRRKADPYFPAEIGKSIIIPPEEKCHASALKVTLLEKRLIEDAHCIQSTVSILPLKTTSHNIINSRPITDDEYYGEGNYAQKIVFNHLLYFSWPDHGVPDPKDRDSLLTFLHLVDRTNRDTSRCSVHVDAPPDHVCPEIDADPPIIVGCSAGVGRTGSFIALSSLLRYYTFLPPTAQTTRLKMDESPLGPIPNEYKDDLVIQEIDALREQRPGMVQRPEQVLLIYEVLADAFRTREGL